jgi:hypothetical protein
MDGISTLLQSIAEEIESLVHKMRIKTGGTEKQGFLVLSHLNTRINRQAGSLTGKWHCATFAWSYVV